MIAPDGAAKIMDFGLATFIDAGGATRATGNVVGTPDYMSPSR
jgi:serine/threonine protein kinase